MRTWTRVAPKFAKIAADLCFSAPCRARLTSSSGQSSPRVLTAPPVGYANRRQCRRQYRPRKQEAVQETM
eukprot:1138547-Pelagomonas_calceolata.AAC.10